MYFLRKYGEATTIDFGLRDTAGVLLKSDAVYASGDVNISKDEGADTPISSGFVDEGLGYSMPLSATEMEAARIKGYIEDQGTPVWLGREFTIETYGHADAQFPYMNEGVWDRELKGNTHNIPTSAGRRLRQLAGNIYDDGTAQAGGVNNLTLAAGASAVDGVYFQTYLAIVEGTGAGQGHHIVGYNGTTKVATIDDDWVVQPDNTSVYILYGSGSHEAIEEGTPTAVSNNTITLNSYSPTVDQQYKHHIINIISGTGNRQSRRIIDYNGTTKVATVVANWDTNPTTGSGYWVDHRGLTVDDVWDEPLLSSTHNVNKSSGKRLRELLEIAGYEGGFIYYDSVNGAAGSEKFVNGILENPVNNETDLLALKAALNMDQVKIKPGSTLTLTASHEKQQYIGEAWTLNLGGQSISASFFHGATSVNGIATGVIPPKFCDCTIKIVTMPPSSYHKCGFAGVFTVGSAGDFFFVGDSHSAVAGVGTPSFSYGIAIGVTNFNFRGYHGGQNVKDMDNGDNLSFDGDGQIIIDSSSGPGVMRIAGHQKMTGAEDFIEAGGTIEDSARFAVDQFPVTACTGGGGSSTPSYAEEGEPECIVQGDVVNIPRYIIGDQSAKTLFHGAKVASGDESYVIGVIQCTVGDYDAVTNKTAYLIPYTANDTKTVTPNVYKGETEVRDANGISNPVTGDRFDLNVIGEIVT